MRFALCLYKHFPYSGLSRDMRRIAAECLHRGHEVRVFTREWEGPRLDGVRVNIIPAPGLTNHGRCRRFHQRLAEALSGERFDAVIGFNKMPGLDVYYAADDCYVDRAARRRGSLYGLTPRYRHLAAFEEAVFSPESDTRILLIAEREKLAFQEYYGTDDSRFHLLPPTLDPSRKPVARSPDTRKRVRDDLGVSVDDQLLLLVGSGFKTKGVDRALRALAALAPAQRATTALVVVGQDKAAPYKRMAARLGLGQRVQFLGGRSDVPELLAASDLLIHPAYNEAGGTILLEAITSGCPVLTTDVCGYAGHVESAKAGRVLASPFCQSDLNAALADMLDSDERAHWSANGIAYGANPDLYAMAERAVDIIETHAARRAARRDAPALKRDPRTVLYVRDDLRTALGERAAFEPIMAIDGRVYRRAPGRRTVRFTTGGKSYFLKTHTGVGWREILKNLLYLRAPVLGAMNEWHGLHRLKQLGIDTMEIAGFGSSSGNPARRRSFIITDELAGTESLEDFCGRRFRHPARTRDDVLCKRALIRRLASIARSIHTNGANHRDFYLCHFLLRNPVDVDTFDPEHSRIHLIDLHRMQIRRRTPLRWAIKDISGLYYSCMDLALTRRDLYRFMCAYRDQPLRKLLTDDMGFWRRVSSRAKRLYGQEARKAHRRVAHDGAEAVGPPLGR